MIDNTDRMMLIGKIQDRFSFTEMTDIRFLLSLDTEALESFMLTMPTDDIVYAEDLLKRARLAFIEACEAEAPITNLDLAKSVLNKYRINQ